MLQFKMASAGVTKLSKPQMRGLLNSQITRNLVGALVCSIGAGLAFKFLVGEPRKKRYIEFYKNYDAEKDFERMRKAGVFQSVTFMAIKEEIYKCI
ncbi:hypothetical protein J437_LFUL001081, partial [Ladona fulva]